MLIRFWLDNPTSPDTYKERGDWASPVTVKVQLGVQLRSNVLEHLSSLVRLLRVSACELTPWCLHQPLLQQMRNVTATQNAPDGSDLCTLKNSYMLAAWLNALSWEGMFQKCLHLMWAWSEDYKATVHKSVWNLHNNQSLLNTLQLYTQMSQYTVYSHISWSKICHCQYWYHLPMHCS